MTARMCCRSRSSVSYQIILIFENSTRITYRLNWNTKIIQYIYTIEQIFNKMMKIGPEIQKVEENAANILFTLWCKKTEIRDGGGDENPIRRPLVFQKRKTEGLVGAQLSNYFPTYLDGISRPPPLLQPRRRWRNIVPTTRITTADGFKPRSASPSRWEIALEIAPRWILNGWCYLHQVTAAEG